MGTYDTHGSLTTNLSAEDVRTAAAEDVRNAVSNADCIDEGSLCQAIFLLNRLAPVVESLRVSVRSANPDDRRAARLWLASF